MATHGFFDRNGVPYFGSDSDDDGGFQYQQLATTESVDAAVAVAFAQMVGDGLNAFPVSFYVPGDVNCGEHYAYTVVFPTGMRILGLIASVSGAPSGSDIVLDLVSNGASAFQPGNLFTVPDGQTIGAGSPDVTDFPNLARLSLVVTQRGATNPGTGLAITMLARWIVPFLDGTNQP